MSLVSLKNCGKYQRKIYPDHPDLCLSQYCNLYRICRTHYLLNITKTSKVTFENSKASTLAKIFRRKTMCYSNSVLVISAIFVILPLLTQSQVFFGNEGSRRPSSDFFFPNTETNNNKGSQKNDVSLRNILGLEGEQQNIVGRL